jgi:hypothetical protein
MDPICVSNCADHPAHTGNRYFLFGFQNTRFVTPHRTQRQVAARLTIAGGPGIRRVRAPSTALQAGSAALGKGLFTHCWLPCSPRSHFCPQPNNPLSSRQRQRRDLPQHGRQTAAASDDSRLNSDACCARNAATAHRGAASSRHRRLASRSSRAFCSQPRVSAVNAGSCGIQHFSFSHHTRRYGGSHVLTGAEVVLRTNQNVDSFAHPPQTFIRRAASLQLLGGIIRHDHEAGRSCWSGADRRAPWSRTGKSRSGGTHRPTAARLPRATNARLHCEPPKCGQAACLLAGYWRAVAHR